MSTEYFAHHNFTIPMPLIESEFKLHKKKETFERFERVNDLFSCENQCNTSTMKKQIKLSRRSSCKCECVIPGI
jgi:hypothetical protein